MNETKTRCKVCAKLIPEGAKKCTECNEYQSTLFRVLAGFDLKGIIALIPIATLAFAFIQDRVETKTSDLKIALVTCEQNKVSLFASNIGNRAAIISGASFVTNDLPSMSLSVTLPPSKRLIDGGETRAIDLLTDARLSPGGLVPFEQRNANICEVTISIETIAFDHELKTQDIVCDCPR